MKLSLNLDVIKKIAEKQLWTINTGQVDENGKTLKKPLNIRRLFGEEMKKLESSLKNMVIVLTGVTVVARRQRFANENGTDSEKHPQ